MINCIAFDMDDTLYDEIDYSKSGFLVAARQIADDFKLKDKVIFETLWQIFNSGITKPRLTLPLKSLVFPSTKTI